MHNPEFLLLANTLGHALFLLNLFLGSFHQTYTTTLALLLLYEMGGAPTLRFDDLHCAGNHPAHVTEIGRDNN